MEKGEGNDEGVDCNTDEELEDVLKMLF